MIKPNHPQYGLHDAADKKSKTVTDGAWPNLTNFAKGKDKRLSYNGHLRVFPDQKTLFTQKSCHIWMVTYPPQTPDLRSKPHRVLVAPSS